MTIGEIQAPLHLPREVFVVRDDYKRGAAPLRQLEHHREHLIGAFLIEVSGRFVREHDGGVGYQRARDGDALSFATG